MKKSLITIVSILLCVGYGVLSWDIVTHSEPPGPEDSPYAEVCSKTVSSNNAAPKTDYDMCCIDFNDALDAVKRDWQNNLGQLAIQERAASDMVDDAYESLRTFNCWAEYICRAVLYSGHAPIESALGTGLKEVHLGTVPGCQSPDNLRMEAEYNQFIKALEDVPLGGKGVTAFKDIMTENKINYFPRCMTDPNNNSSPSLVKAKENYDACKRTLQYHFNCSEYLDTGFCLAQSSAFVTLENVLKKASADQKASALERKLGSVVGKMHGMEMHVGYLENFLIQLDSRFSCYAAKCS